MPCAAQEHASLAGHQHIGKLAPIFVVMIDDDRDLWILPDITQAFQFAWGGSFRFLIDGRIKIFAVEDKANRDDVRLAAGVRGGEMGDAGGADESKF